VTVREREIVSVTCEQHRSLAVVADAGQVDRTAALMGHTPQRLSADFGANRDVQPDRTRAMQPARRGNVPRNQSRCLRALCQAECAST